MLWRSAGTRKARPAGIALGGLALLLALGGSLAAETSKLAAAAQARGEVPVGALLPLAEAAAGAAAEFPGARIAWTHSASDLEELVRAALPLRFEIGGGWSGLFLVVEEISGLKIQQGRLRMVFKGRTEPLGVPIEADAVLSLRFDALEGVHVVSLESLPVSLGAFGKADLAKLLGPWTIRPRHAQVIPIEGGDGLGVQILLRSLVLGPDGLRAEASVRYFKPPAD
ncbi:MAG: hypothetical protein V3U98_02895 [Acidobacteriota bacterium]